MIPARAAAQLPDTCPQCGNDEYRARNNLIATASIPAHYSVTMYCKQCGWEMRINWSDEFPSDTVIKTSKGDTYRRTIELQSDDNSLLKPELIFVYRDDGYFHQYIKRTDGEIDTIILREPKKGEE